MNYYIQHWHVVIPDDLLTVGLTYFITLHSYNTHGLSVYEWYRLIYDISEPVPGEVHVVTTSVPGEVSPTNVACQESMTHVIVTWTPFGEDNSVMDR